MVMSYKLLLPYSIIWTQSDLKHYNNIHLQAKSTCMYIFYCFFPQYISLKTRLFRCYFCQILKEFILLVKVDSIRNCWQSEIVYCLEKFIIWVRISYWKTYLKWNNRKLNKYVNRKRQTWNRRSRWWRLHWTIARRSSENKEKEK